MHRKKGVLAFFEEREWVGSIRKEIDYKELAHVVMEAGKSQRKQGEGASWSSSSPKACRLRLRSQKAKKTEMSQLEGNQPAGGILLLEEDGAFN